MSIQKETWTQFYAIQANPEDPASVNIIRLSDDRVISKGLNRCAAEVHVKKLTKRRLTKINKHFEKIILMEGN